MDGNDNSTGITKTAYEQGKEIAALTESVKALCRSVDDLREEFRELRDKAATKDDLKTVTVACPQCPTIDKRLARTEDILFGTSPDDPGLVGRFNETEEQVGKLKVRIYGISAVGAGIGVVIGWASSLLGIGK